MKYLYYPGCSLKGTGRAYEESLQAVFRVLGVPCKELPDWNCCGATTYMSIDEMKALALAARNLALAERQETTNGDDAAQLVAPCSACFLVLTKAQRYLAEYTGMGQEITGILLAAGMRYEGRVRIRHPLDVLVNDVGLEKVAGHVKRPLKGLRVACYYGCQVVRPYALFDQQHNPTTMDRLLQAAGATCVDWPLKTRCCGSSLTGTIQDVGLRLSYILLKEARARGADVVATACPLCQFNLECYQDKMSRQFKDRVEMPVAYFTQLLGAAYGIPARTLGLHRLFHPLGAALTARQEVAHARA